MPARRCSPTTPVASLVSARRIPPGCKRLARRRWCGSARGICLRQLLVLAIQPVPLAPDDAAGREHFHIKPPVVGGRVGLAPGLECLERSPATRRLVDVFIIDYIEDIETARS